MGSRLSILSYYSLRYANSNTGGAGNFPSNPLLGLSADYGRAGFDVRNRLFLGGTVSLAHGFRVSPFIVANSGPPFNITLGQDLNGDSIFNDRPAFATSATAPANLRQTAFGNFDVAPAPGEARIPINFGTQPAQFTVNMRLANTFAIVPNIKTANPNPGQRGAQGGGAPAGGHGPSGGGDRAAAGRCPRGPIARISYP